MKAWMKVSKFDFDSDPFIDDIFLKLPYPREATFWVCWVDTDDWLIVVAFPSYKVKNIFFFKNIW